MKLGNIKGRTTKVTLAFDEDTLNLEVRPWLMTPAIERSLMKGNPEDQLATLLDFFAEYVASWDLTDDDGETIALDPDTIAQVLPSAMVIDIMRRAKDAADPLA